MTFISILETLLIGPLKLIFEVIFEIANRLIGNPGWAIVVLSLTMNILVLPLYKRADAIQEEAKNMDEKLHKGVTHIKKTFSGDERMMMLQTYYRQNNYKPTDALKGSVSLLLEVPFFMAAYQFLSNLTILNGVSFGPIANLGAPDGLLVIGGVAINLLPVIMTLVNIISSMLYLKGYPLKTKIQLYSMALFFLVFLYKSPSCLVFYWTLNNVFALVKTIFYKIKEPQKVLSVLCSASGLAMALYGIALYDTTSLKRKVFVIGLGLLLQAPIIVSLLKKKLHIKAKETEANPSFKLFILGALVLTILVGALIPSTFIAASPQEYIDATYFHNPLWYIVSALSLSAGTFLVWMGIFYGLANKQGRAIFEKAVWVLCGVMLVNYMFFGTDLGVISSTLQYEDGLNFLMKDQFINLAVVGAVALALYFFAKKWKKATATIMLTAIIALGGMSVMNAMSINKSVGEVSVVKAGEMPELTLSKNGQNVVVIMMDRAMGTVVPAIMKEKPELKEKFDGFTYYENTLAYGISTNICTPSLFGGYEYTPVEINKRSEESLKDKQNEALKVMPVLFSENGYDVTVCDQPYANYEWIFDTSLYNEYENIDAYILEGLFTDKEGKQQAIDNNHRNFFCFSVMKSMPLFMQETIYQDGQYNASKGASVKTGASTQVTTGLSKGTGINDIFMKSYSVLENLTNITKVTDSEKNTFLSLTNNATHEPVLLQAPDYTPAETVDNTEYDAQNADRFNVDGAQIGINNDVEMKHYHANMASFIQLANWFDYLKANGVYDNTRIILVADHGRALNIREELAHDYLVNFNKSVEGFFPLLMVKDFNSKGFTTSDEFMTTADVPTLATNDLIKDPTNPFTGNKINSDEKQHEQLVMHSTDWDITKNNGNTFSPSKWLSIKDNIWNKENWKFYNQETVLDEHKLPQ